MPAQPDGTMTEARPMGLHHQQSACSLLERNVRHQDHTHALVVEREEVDRYCLAIDQVKLQSTLLLMAHRPILHVTACVR